MWFLELMFVLATVLLVTSLFSAAGLRYGPWSRILWLFVMLFVVTWAFGVWLRPIGPPVWGAYWAPYVLVGVFLALLLAAAAPVSRRPPPQPPGAKPLPGARTPAELEDEQIETEIAVEESINIFFWLVLLLAAVAIVLRYTLPGV